MALRRLSQLDDWQLVHDDQDIRGHTMMDAEGHPIGTVDDLIVNTDTERVEMIVLDDGTEYDADAIEIDDRQAYLKDTATPSGDASFQAYTGTRAERVAGPAFADYDTAFREHYRTTYGEDDFSTYESAYRLGHRYGAREEHRNRTYEDLRPEMRRSYEERHGEGTFARVEDAVRHAFNRTRRSLS